MSINLTSPYAADSNTPPVDVEDSQELEIDPPHSPSHTDLSEWRSRANIGSGHEDDPGSPSSLLDSSFDEGDYTYIRVDSPPPLDDYLANAKDERRYRMLLEHEFHPSRRLSQPDIPTI